MIVKMHSTGTSFKGLGDYLRHDADKKNTSERVAWTHTRNLANDHVPSAIDEMLWTARDAELLKQEAGIRAGGRPTATVAKHISLNWGPDERPSEEHMKETCDAFLRHMKWDEHQAVLVAHQDKAHRHVHIMLNALHPETGRKLDDGFEKRRAQAWALEYERGQDNILCKERLRDVRERAPSMTREAWTAFKEMEDSLIRDQDRYREISEKYFDGEKYPEGVNRREWLLLKENQKNEQEKFFDDGKLLYSEIRRTIYQEVREEFRPRWANYYAAMRRGDENIAELKAEIRLDQKNTLEERRDDALAELHFERDKDFRELLQNQESMRAELWSRQTLGISSLEHMEAFAVDQPGRTAELLAAFREEGRDMTGRPEEWQEGWIEEASVGTPRERGGFRSPFSVGDQVASGFGSLLVAFADGLLSGKRAPPPKRIERDTTIPTPVEFEAEKSRQQTAQDKKIEDERWYRERQRE